MDVAATPCKMGAYHTHRTSLHIAAQRKINSFRQQYADNQNISFLPAIVSTSTRMHGEFLRLFFLQAHRETEAHFTAAGMSSQRNHSDSFRFKRKVSEEALLTRSSKAMKPMNACGHTYTKSQTPSTRRRGPGWRIHGSVEDTELSTNKQHSLNEAYA